MVKGMSSRRSGVGRMEKLGVGVQEYNSGFTKFSFNNYFHRAT